MNTSLKHMSIRSRLVSQQNNKLISNGEQLFNEKQIGKPIRNHLDLFINTSLHYVSIRSCLQADQKIN